MTFLKKACKADFNLLRVTFWGFFSPTFSPEPIQIIMRAHFLNV